MERAVLEGRISRDVGNLFLNSPRRKTGNKHPIQFCVDDATLADCLRELGQVTGRRETR